jgi:hypothetical protein
VFDTDIEREEDNEGDLDCDFVVDMVTEAVNDALCVLLLLADEDGVKLSDKMWEYEDDVVADADIEALDERDDVNVNVFVDEWLKNTVFEREIELDAVLDIL